MKERNQCRYRVTSDDADRISVMLGSVDNKGAELTQISGNQTLIFWSNSPDELTQISGNQTLILWSNSRAELTQILGNQTLILRSLLHRKKTKQRIANETWLLQQQNHPRTSASTINSFESKCASRVKLFSWNSLLRLLDTVLMDAVTKFLCFFPIYTNAITISYSPINSYGAEKKSLPLFAMEILWSAYSLL